MRKGSSITGLFVLCMCVLFALIWFAGNRNSSGNENDSGNEKEMYYYICKTIGFTLPKDVAIDYTDSHGGFHGDGNLFAVVTANNEQAKSEMETLLSRLGWNSALSEEMYAAFFGGIVTIEGIEYTTNGYLHDFEFDIPNVKKGYFYYKDRFFEQNGKQCQIAPYTQNFTLAIFDLDTNTLYFIEGDM